MTFGNRAGKHRNPPRTEHDISRNRIGTFWDSSRPGTTTDGPGVAAGTGQAGFLTAVSWVLAIALLVGAMFAMLAQTTTQGYAPPASAYLLVFFPALLVAIFTVSVVFSAYRKTRLGPRFWWALFPALFAVAVAAVMGIQAVGARLRQRGAAPAASVSAGHLNPVKRAAGDPVSSLEFRLEAPSPSPPEAIRMTGARSEEIALLKEPVVRNSDITTVAVEEAGSSFRVALHLTPEAGTRMRAATRAFPGRRMAILLDGKVVAAPVIRGTIGEDAMIDARFSRDEAYRIARAIAP